MGQGNPSPSPSSSVLDGAPAANLQGQLGPRPGKRPRRSTSHRVHITPQGPDHRGAGVGATTGGGTILGTNRLSRTGSDCDAPSGSTARFVPRALATPHPFPARLPAGRRPTRQSAATFSLSTTNSTHLPCALETSRAILQRLAQPWLRQGVMKPLSRWIRAR